MRCRVLLQGAARCCPVPGFFSFSLLVLRSRRALVGWYAFRPRLGLVLALFWLRFFLLMLHLRWCCEQHKQQKQQKQDEQKQQRTSSSTSSEPARAARAASAAAAGSDRRRVAPPLIFAGDFKGKSVCWLRERCFLEFSNFLWFVEFIGARKESSQKTMLVMWLQRRDVPSVFTALATQYVPSAVWCELSRQLVDETRW